MAGVREAVESRKRALSYVSAVLLALVPWTQVSKAVSQKAALDGANLALAVLAGISLHACYLAVNTLAVRLLRLGGPEPSSALGVRRAVVLTTSVKTLPVAVTVLSKLAATMGDGIVGVAVVPCVLAHLSQIMWDSVMVSGWLAADAKREAGGAEGDGGGQSVLRGAPS